MGGSADKTGACTVKKNMRGARPDKAAAEPERRSDEIDSHANELGGEIFSRPHSTVGDWSNRSHPKKQKLTSEQVNVDFISDRPYALNMTTTADIVTLKLGPTQGVKAWNTDKITPIEVTPGHAFMFPKGSTIYSHAEVTSSFPILEISKSFREDVAAEFGIDSAPKFDRIYENVASPVFMPLAQSIRGFLFGEAFLGQMAADAIGVLVLTEVMRSVSNWDAEEAIRGLDPNRLKLALNYIDDELSSDLSTNELAALTGISVFHFTRAFKEATGTSPHQYVLERRLKKARNLLESTMDSLAEIAYEVGFSSQAHMTTVFRKRLGTTPGRYRKDWRS